MGSIYLSNGAGLLNHQQYGYISYNIMTIHNLYLTIDRALVTGLMVRSRRVKGQARLSKTAMFCYRSI